jgi:hypothetical protein
VTDQGSGGVSSANVEAGESLRLLLLDLDGRDRRPARAAAAELDQLLHSIGIALEDRLDRALRRVADPAGDPGRLGAAADGVPEEDPLNPPADDDPPAGQRLLLFFVLGGDADTGSPEDL